MHIRCVSLGMAYVRKVPTGTHTVVDKDTGEMLECTEITRTELVKTKEAFCIQYSKLLSVMSDFSWAEAKVLTWCSFAAGIDTNAVTLNKYYKEQIAEVMNLNKRTIENAIVSLVQKKALTRLGSGVYRVDPELSWRGSLAERTKMVKIHLEYQIENP